MLATLDDAVIAYDYTSTDGGEPPVLFLHGALGVRAHVGDLRQRFGDRSQIAIDFPSHGESTVTHGTLSAARLARDTLALMDALGVGQVDIVGHSMGGYVGLVMAHLAPARVRSVVTLGTKFYWNAGAIDSTLGELDGALLRERSPRAYDALKGMHTASGVDATFTHMQALIADFGRWQVTEDMLRASGVPVLACTGDRDAMVPPAEVVKLFAALDGKQHAMAVLPNTPHPIQKLATDCFVLAVRRFWEQCRPS